MRTGRVEFRVTRNTGELQSKCSRPCYCSTLRSATTIAGSCNDGARAWRSRSVLRASRATYVTCTCAYTMQRRRRKTDEAVRAIIPGLVHLCGTRLILGADPFYLASRGYRLKKERKEPRSFCQPSPYDDNGEERRRSSQPKRELVVPSH